MTRLFAFWVLTAAAMFGQTGPEFEVASIKPSTTAPEGMFALGVHVDGAQFRCTYLSLKEYIATAYRLKVYQLSVPDWMASTRFDISAKLPEGATRAQIPAMMRKLLEDRFQLKTHMASKEFSVYALTVAKGGPKMEAAQEESGAGGTPAATNVNVSGAQGNVMLDLGNGSSISFGESSLIGKKVDMAALVDQLGRFLDRPVVDATDLKGRYNLQLDFQPDEFRLLRIRAAVSAGISLPPQALRLLEGASDGPLLTAVQSLGLRLESRKAPLDVLVVDAALKVPTEN